MTSLASDKPNLPAPGDGANDPFVTRTPAPAHHRYSAFDDGFFATGPASSPRQAKRALEAHLAETERRLEEAGKLGTALVTQRKALTERLQEVEKLQAEGELNPDLRQKLVEIEKEYNDLARESARAFLPKQRVPSNEANPNSPFAPEGRSGRRSVSPSKFESQATGSPTKLTVPNRKIRNQPSNRVHDIEFAAEISTSLIAQVRNLQSLLAERDEEVKDLKQERARLEIESESFQQRAKALDESEHRYKEENWNLETKLQELSSQQKEAADREKKLTQSLNLSKAEKIATQKELDEVKLSHSKLAEEHSSAVKHLDIELGTAKRNMAMAEGERSAMQRKIDELTSQNQELAKAFSTQRGRTLEREYQEGTSDEERDSAADNVTPEHSPPPSPVKGTPRHSILETETMKSSLHHAQRTIQSQRSLLHREKTEKLEMRRIIQELRDDLEKARTDSHGSASNRRSKKDSKEFKKPPRLLGSFRSSRQEVVQDDPDWEDHQDLSPRTLTHVSPVARQAGDFSVSTDMSDHFDTANEASESAFETANERATETEDFQTVNEELSDSDDAETETESTSRGFGRMKRPPSLPVGLARVGRGDTYHSTASTSADEDDLPYLLRTPTATLSSQRNSRFRLSRGPFTRSSRQPSEEPALRSSPASFADSAGETPQAGQSLFAELQDFEASDDESVGGMTPSRRSVRSVTPGSYNRRRSPTPAVPALPRVVMVDSGVMTDPVEFAPKLPAITKPAMVHSGMATEDYDESPPGSPISVVARDRPMSMQSAVGPDNRNKLLWPSIQEDDTDGSRPVSMAYSDAGAQHDPDMEEKLAQFPAPPGMLPPILSLPPPLSLSSISCEEIEPREELIVPPSLSMTSVLNESVEPLAEPEIPVPELSLSSIVAEGLEPQAEPESPRPELSFSAVVAENLQPQALPPPDLAVSQIFVNSLEPVPEPETPAPDLSLSNILVENVEPVAEPERPAATMNVSSILSESLEPVAEPEVEPVMFIPPPPSLSMSTIQREHVEPIAPRSPSLTLSTILGQQVEPVSPVLPELGLSAIQMEHVEPIAEPAPEPILPELCMSSIVGEDIEPVAVEPPQLSISSIKMESVEPVSEPQVVVLPPSLGLSSISTEQVEPVSEPQPAQPAFALSPIAAEDVTPGPASRSRPPNLVLSSIAAEGVEPISPVQHKRSVPSFRFSLIETIETLPILPRSPRRHGFVLPKDMDSPFIDSDGPQTPTNKPYVLNRVRSKEESPIIAEDETRQSLNDTPEAETPESQRPFKEISTNSNARPAKKHATTTTDQGAQTSLTSDVIDAMFKSRSRAAVGFEKNPSVTSFGTHGSTGTTGTVKIHPPKESIDSPERLKVDDFIYGLGYARKLGSATSGSTSKDAPPLPPNHRQVIEAARSGSAQGSQSSMGPPLRPASALKRPTTPSQKRPTSASSRGTPTPRAVRVAHETLKPPSPSKLDALSRKSSVSSFASELDALFNIRPSDNRIDPTGFGPNTDPRMIQAITQTMIGEYLWKYVRKAGREEMSDYRHRRYFWVHPYTRSLYWSTLDPLSAGRAELKAKSVPIEAVRVITDDNPLPPGLHRKSLVVISPGRTVQFTCPTGQRHETWFNALSYMLVRTNVDGQTDVVDDMAESITREDVKEFNPQLGQRPAKGSQLGAPPSLSSYNSQATRNESSAMNMSMSIPTLTPTLHKKSSANLSSTGTFSKLSGYWKSGTFSGRRGRAVSGQDLSVYEASEVHDSAEDLREIIEQQDRDADQLENVRACCDGKHDVGALHHHSKRGRSRNRTIPFAAPVRPLSARRLSIDYETA